MILFMIRISPPGPQRSEKSRKALGWVEKYIPGHQLIIIPQSLARRLIHAANQMDELPSSEFSPTAGQQPLILIIERRFAAFKLFYYDHTPDDYEPPHFRKGDVDKDKWYFATHDKTEIPERTDVGRLETGWHS